jgi:hypothetical protein
MNIDYAAIIQKANDRKDALMRFEAAVRRLSGEINESREPDIIEALRHFQHVATALDQEAQSMLPVNSLHPVLAFANNVLQMWSYVDRSGTSCTAPDTPRKALYRLAEE